MDINYYLSRIKNNKCVLFLGPEFPFLLNNQNRHDTINNHLEANGIKVSQYRDDDFFFFEQPASRYRTHGALMDMYEQLAPSPIYDELVKIPVSLIISLSPEWFYKESYEQVFEKDMIEAVSYKKETPVLINRVPTPDQPILYNLFGDINDEDSLIMSFDDLYNFFSTLFTKKLADPIQITLKNATDFIFVGFKFNAWYLKLMLRILDINEYRNVNHCFNQEHQPNDQLMLFYREHFKFEYPKMSTPEFIHAIYTALDKSGDVRKPTERIIINTNALLQLINKDKLGEVMDRLLALKTGDATVNLFYAEYSALKKEMNRGVLKVYDRPYLEFRGRLTDYIQTLK